MITYDKKKKIWEYLKEDVKTLGHDPERTIARSVQAVIGAVYFDKGFQAAQRVMHNLNLTIKMHGR